MATKSASFESNFDDYKQILEFKKDFKTNIIENGLDKIVNKSLEQLKITLKDAINERVKVPNSERVPKSAIATKNALDQPTVNIPKSLSDILEYLTDGKTKANNYNSVNNFSTLQSSGFVAGSYDRGMNKADRLTLRMEINPGETVQDQHMKAKSFFTNAIIAIPNYDGQTAYFMNNGIDISDYVKIKCSTMTGDGNTKPKKGMSPQERFDRDSSGKSYAQWTLKKEAVDIIRREYINLTPIINSIKDGQFNKALIELKSMTKINDTNLQLDLRDKLTDLKDNSPKVSKKMSSYIRVIRTVDELDIKKEIKFNTTIYSLDFKVTTTEIKPKSEEDLDADAYGIDDTEEQEEFLSVSRKIETTIRKWVASGEEDWFQDLIRQTDNLIRMYISENKLTMRATK